MKKLTLLLLALLYVTLTYAYTERDLLQKQADINRLKRNTGIRPPMGDLPRIIMTVPVGTVF